MSSLLHRPRWALRILLLVALITGVLAMHGLADAHDGSTHHAASVPGVAAADGAPQHHSGPSDADSMAHLGALCLWLAVTGVVALRPRDGGERLRCAPSSDAAQTQTMSSFETVTRSRSPGLVPSMDRLRC